MPNCLYLDNARLGLMSPSAQRMEHAFVRLASEGSLTLYFREWLDGGARAMPDYLQRRFSGLSAWQGIKGLKRDLKRVAGAESDSHVLVASRSAQLMKLAARLLFERCRNVLTTDLSWPTYHRILETEARRAGRRVTRVALRRLLLGRRIDCDTTTHVLNVAFARHECDGLFLPAVDNLGVRLPIRQIVAAVGRRHEIRFTVVDGAQALGHIPLQLADNTCDMFLAGVHKWLCAYHPMGIAYYGNARSATRIGVSLRHHLGNGHIDDPLLRLTEQLESGQTTGYGETVGLLPLATAQGALCDALKKDNRPGATIDVRLANADRLASLARKFGWRAVRPADTMRTGICLLRSPGGRSTRITPETMHARFRKAGVAVTTYPGGLVRFSMPPTAWTGSETGHLSHALAHYSLVKARVASVATP